MKRNLAETLTKLLDDIHEKKCIKKALTFRNRTCLITSVQTFEEFKMF